LGGKVGLQLLHWWNRRRCFLCVHGGGVSSKCELHIGKMDDDDFASQRGSKGKGAANCKRKKPTRDEFASAAEFEVCPAAGFCPESVAWLTVCGDAENSRGKGQVGVERRADLPAMHAPMHLCAMGVIENAHASVGPYARSTCKFWPAIPMFLCSNPTLAFCALVSPARSLTRPLVRSRKSFSFFWVFVFCLFWLFVYFVVFCLFLFSLSL
jgi:hypothetical protein